MSGTPLHRERLWPSAATWLLPLLAAGFGGVSLLPVSRPAAVVAAVVAAAATAAVLLRASALVEVTADGGLRAGRAVLPPPAVGPAVPATGARATALRGVELDARTHLLLRGWVGPVVLVGVDDEADPTPSWLVSTRDPEHLAAALRQVAER